MPDRTLIWLCVSSDEQASPNRTSLDTQLERCQAACSAAGDIVVAILRPPTEEGFSRFYSRIDQMIQAYPPYRQMVELIESGAITKAVALRYDRYWRTAALATQLTAIAEEHGVWLYSCEEPTSREGWMDNAWLRMIHSVQPEEAIRKFVADHRRGMAGRADRGLPVCTSRRPYGYLLVGRGKDRKLVPCEEERRGVELIMRRRAEGWSGYRIKRELERLGVPGPKGRPWCRKTVCDLYKNPVYAGYIRVKLWPRRPKTPRRGPPVVHIGKGAHEPLISEELWQAVQRINESRTRDYTRNGGASHLLTGLCKCALCGASMIYQQHPVKPGYPGGYSLICSRYHGRQGCQRNSHSERALRRQVIEWLTEVLRDPDRWARALDAPDQRQERERRIVALERELAGLDRRRGNLLAAIETAANGQDRQQFVARYDDLSARHAQVLAELQALRNATARIDQAKARLVAWRDAAEDLECWSDEQLRPLLLQLIDRVVLCRGRPPKIIVAGLG